MALLWGLYLLQAELGLTLSAAHFNHHLRGAESDADEAFVREFCQHFDIPLHTASGDVKPGKKGLEAAAREARYAFLKSLPGKIATAHTADDNAETVLMHLVRGSGLKGLGGIAPVNGQLIRPMLNITRRQVEDFLEEYHIAHREDSSNAGDDFLRNRIRHRVMPLLQAENPCLAENVSAMAQRLREDEQVLARLANCEELPSVTQLRELPPAIRNRILERFLCKAGIGEPEAKHIALLENLVFSPKPSAVAQLPFGVRICRNYDRLEVWDPQAPLGTYVLPEAGDMEIPGYRIRIVPAREIVNTETVFTVQPQGALLLRCRHSGDTIKLSGGTKTVKKLFIDRKIPAQKRLTIPVIVDEKGLLGVYGIGADQTRVADTLPAVQIHLEQIKEK